MGRNRFSLRKLLIFSIVTPWLIFGSLFLMGADLGSLFKTVITNETEDKIVGVELIDGKNRLLTSSITIIDQLFGRDPQATTWFYIGTQDDATGVGAAGDTVRVQIPAATTPLDTVYPAVDVTTTVTAPMVAADNPERELALQICSDLNGDSNFQDSEWKCEVIKDFSGVFISSRLFNEFGQRTTWTLSSTGTTVVTKAFDDIVTRGFSTELARSPNDPRKGVLAISGSVLLNPAAATDLFTEFAETVGASNDMAINCSTFVAANCEFFINADPVNEKIVQALTFSAVDNGMKYNQFLGSSTLSNGILVEIKSQDITSSFEVITTTDNFEDSWAITPQTFRLTVASGGDHLNGTKDLTAAPIILAPQGTFSTDDFIKISIRDNLNSVDRLDFRAKGFERTP